MPANMTTSMSYLWSPQAILLSRRVALLSATEECWYRRALDYAWIDEGLSANPTEAADRIGKKCTPSGAKKIIDLFFIPDRKDPLKVVNEKQELLRNKLKKKLRNLSENGKRSGQKRREKRDLASEQKLNKGSTDDEQMPSNKDIKEINVIKEEEKREEAPPPNASDFAPPQNVPPKESLFYHPVIEALRIVTKKCPPTETRQHLINKVEGEIDLAKLQIAFGEWRSRGYKDTNFDGILDWYLGNKNGTSKSGYQKRTDADVLAESKDFYDRYPS